MAEFKVWDDVVYRNHPAKVTRVCDGKWEGWVMIKRPGSINQFRVKKERLTHANDVQRHHD